MRSDDRLTKTEWKRLALVLTAAALLVLAGFIPALTGVIR